MANDWRDLPEKLKEKDLLIPIAIVIVVVASFVFLGPTITGYMSYKDQLDSCKNDLKTCQTNVQDLNVDIESLKSDLNFNKEVIVGQNNTINQLEIEIQNKTDEYNKSHSILLESYVNLANNSASNICCKMWFDNNHINSWNIDVDKISCAVDGEGDYELFCNFPN